MYKLMKLILGLVGIVAILYGSICLVGLANPQGIILNASASIDVPIEKVWELLNDPKKYPEWLDVVRSGNKDTYQQKQIWIFVLKGSNELRHFQVTDALPSHTLTLQLVTDPKYYYYLLKFSLSEEKEITTVQIHQEQVFHRPYERGMMKLKRHIPSSENFPRIIAQSLEKWGAKNSR